MAVPIWELLEPPGDLDDTVGSPLPDVIPDWVLTSVGDEGPLFEPGCDCCGGSRLSSGHASAPARWAIPGVTGLATAGLPAVTPEVAELQRVVRAVCVVDPTAQAPGQALVDTAALLAVARQLHVHQVHRLADVAARELPVALGYRSTSAWLRLHRPDGDSGDARLGRALRQLPVLSGAMTAAGPLAGTAPAGAPDPVVGLGSDAVSDPCPPSAVTARAVSPAAAKQVVHALRRCRPHVDRPDGLIDGLPGALVVEAVVRNVIDLVCREHGGLPEDSPLLAELAGEVERILATGRSQQNLLERAFTLLAQHVPVRSLTGRLEELVLAVVPSLLEDKAREGADRARLSLDRKPDGSGWTVSGELDLECGERLFTALRAEAARDPRNPADTAAAAALRNQGIDPWHPDRLGTADGPSDGDNGWDPERVWGPDVPGREVVGPFGLGGPELVLPRDRRRRLHDALNRLLGRYLDHGLGGVAGKAVVQINVTIPDRAVTGEPGALPATADSGTPLPRSLVRRWWCDGRITAYVLGQGGKALRTVHLGRTVTARERTALAIKTGRRCVGLGCCPGEPDPLIPLRPHHVFGHAQHGRTTMNETVMACDNLHADLHEGRKTVRLRDGRLLNEHGWVNPDDHKPWP